MLSLPLKPEIELGLIWQIYIKDFGKESPKGEKQL